MINQNTLIDVGFPLSRNFLLEHVSSGAYHHMTGEWMPKFSAKIIPRASGQFGIGGNIPLWNVVDNLQAGAENLLERFLGGFGRDLQVMSGFLNNLQKSAESMEGQHLAGSSFDIQISGYQNNMYNVAKEVQRLTRGASALELVHGSSTSWIHVGFAAKELRDSIQAAPEFKTIDMVAGVIENGLTSIRGFM